jgi:hypothetical protein
MDENEARSRYGNNVRFIEAPKRAESSVPATPRLTEAQLRAQMAQMGVSGEHIDLLVKQGTATVVVQEPVADTTKEVAMVVESSKVQELVIRELRILFAKYEVVPDDPEVRAEVQYVVNFCLQIWPELEETVNTMKQRATKPRFKL